MAVNVAAKRWYSRLRSAGGIFTVIYNAFDRIDRAISELSIAVDVITAGSVSPFTFSVQLLAANYTVPDPTAVANRSLILYVLRQDETGGRTITWPASFQGMPDADTIDTTAGTQLTALVYKESSILLYPVFPVMSGVSIS